MFREPVGVKVFFLERGDAPPLRAPCARPGLMECGERFRAPGKDELRDLADIEGLGRFLEPRDLGRRNLRDLRPLGPPGHREFRAYGEEVILDLRQDVTNSPFALGSNREADDRVELIDAAHRFDPRVIFRDTSRSEQARVARVASARVELRHWLTLAASVAGGAFGKRIGCRMWARISRPSTSLGPGRLK